MTAPDVILELLAGRRGLDTRAAYLRVDEAGAVTHAGGRLDLFFARTPEPGDSTEAWVWLQGLPVPGEIDRIETQPGRWADALLQQSGDGAHWVLLTEATASLGTMQSILQHTQTLTLAGQDQRRLSDALMVLDAVVFSATLDFRFRPLSRLPDWFSDAVPSLGEDLLDLADTWTFLESFRPDAEAIWALPEVGVVRSGLWTEVSADSEDLPFEATAVRTSEGERILILQRVGDRHTAQQQLLQHARELTMQHQTLGREIEKKEVLLHCIVHDLASPLGAITACLDAVQPETVNRPELKALVDIGLRQARRQSSLIGQVLDVFKADLEASTGFEAPGDRPDLRQRVLDSIEALAPLARLHQVTLEADVPKAAVPVSATTQHLDRVLTNLVENAVRHAPKGSVVGVSVSMQGTLGRAEVRDRGAGVAEADQASLFDKLRQGPAGGKAGLGLYFCRMMVERWQGRIGYESADPGARFWFELPLAQP